MKNTRVLILGNSPQINSIQFNKLAPDVVTLGINRIWLKYIPTYLFFNDRVIIDELIPKKEILSALQNNSIIFSSDWLSMQSVKSKKIIPSWVKVYDRPNKKVFPDSVTTAMSIFTKQYIQNRYCTFYIAGVSLKWTDPSHFWKASYSCSNTHSAEWYTPRFKYIEQNFTRLATLGYNMISVTPESALNKQMRYESINTLYSE